MRGEKELGLRFGTTALSETGRRSKNEDRYFVSPTILAVADGVGGQVAGEIASQWMINALIQLGKRRAEVSAELLQEAVRQASEAITLLSLAHPETSGMSTTLTAVALTEAGKYVVGNVGDSRTHVYRDSRLIQLTRDDSLVQALVDQGQLEPAEAKLHPARSVVTAVVDASGGTPTMTRRTARAGDRMLLCSDGLTDFVDTGNIETILALDNRRTAAEMLVRAALDQGSRDNITVIVADVDAARSAWSPKRRPS